MADSEVESKGHPARRRHGLRVTLFSNFYPSVSRLGPHSTGLAWLVARSPRVSSLNMVVPVGSRLPDGFGLLPVRLSESWRPGHWISLLRTLFGMLHSARKDDLILFNVYPTCFGSNFLANGIGMLIPVVTGMLHPGRVAVYLHNSVDSQDLDSLGYTDAGLAVLVERQIERLMSGVAAVAVPLTMQRDRLEKVWSTAPAAIPLRFTEALPPPGVDLRLGPARSCNRSPDKTNVLLFGAWGPQKNLPEIVDTLSRVSARAPGMRVTLAGHVNVNFPEYAQEIDRARQVLPPGSLDVRLEVSGDDIPALFADSDLVILPYRAAGGNSGVLSIAAFYGLPVIAYDLPELREAGSTTGADIAYISPADAPALQRAIEKIASPSRREVPSDRSLLSKLVAAQSDVDGLLDWAVRPRTD